MVRKFLKDRKAIAGLVIGLVVTMVACAVVLTIGLMIQGNLAESLGVVTAKSNSTTVAENVTFDIFQNVYSAYSLSSVVPLVAGAALIISIIIGAFAIYGRTK